MVRIETIQYLLLQNSTTASFFYLVPTINLIEELKDVNKSTIIF